MKDKFGKVRVLYLLHSTCTLCIFSFLIAFNTLDRLLVVISQFKRHFAPSALLLFQWTRGGYMEPVWSHVPLVFLPAWLKKVLHEVTACISKQGDEKPTLKWSFLAKTSRRGSFSFLRYLKSCGFDHVVGYLPSTPARSDQFRIALPLLRDGPQRISKFRCE